MLAEQGVVVILRDRDIQIVWLRKSVLLQSSRHTAIIKRSCHRPSPCVKGPNYRSPETREDNFSIIFQSSHVLCVISSFRCYVGES